ncbi:hypothetical protein M9H77_23994 [Catharanthus roseus]|uniref:Uncharacterized protein n=1 Tax=Catharanthus roseus TaxID=4058 RepID=A0ACC0AVW8_CATRO|nr:hypothetical protein M9H77_23994 [Catharanthus roseus]
MAIYANSASIEDRLIKVEQDEELALVPAVCSMLQSIRESFAEDRRGIYVRPSVLPYRQPGKMPILAEVTISVGAAAAGVCQSPGFLTPIIVHLPESQGSLFLVLLLALGWALQECYKNGITLQMIRTESVLTPLPLPQPQTQKENKGHITPLGLLPHIQRKEVIEMTTK